MLFLRNEVIDIYTIDLFEKCNLRMHWGDLYWGIKESLLDIKLVSKFAVEFIMSDSQVDIDEIYELAWETEDRESVLNLIERVLMKLLVQENQDYELIMRRWRYCIVKTLKEQEHDISVLFDKVEIIYADFNYPVEMIGFIKYMPTDNLYNSANYSKEESEQRMIDEIDGFIKSEWSYITSKVPIT